MNCELIIEQQFQLRVYSEQVMSLAPDESQRLLLVEIIRQNMIKDNVVKDLLKNK